MISKRLANLKSSYVRDILAVTQRPEIISFAGGLPDPQLFPVKALSESAAALLTDSRNDLYQYANTEGSEQLRHWICAHLMDHPAEGQRTLITHGSQQGLDLIIRCLTDPGDTVLVEAPSYLGAIQCLVANGVRILGVPMCQDGPDLNRLESLLQSNPVKAFYTIPNFQNPTGVSHSAAKRKQLVSLIRQHDIWVIEDDPYGKLRYRGEPLMSLRALCPEKTIYLGSFSKIIAPSFRIGWMNVPDSLWGPVKSMKQVTDLHSSGYTQGIIMKFLAQGSLEPHLQQLCSVYQSRLLAMEAALDRYLPNLERSNPEGGMFIWLSLDQDRETLTLAQKGIRQGIAFVPGEAFYSDDALQRGHIRLNFTNVTPKQIERGVETLAEIL